MDFHCITCRQRFDSIAALHQHCSSLIHPYPCTRSGCRRSFKDRGTLQQHLSSKVHADNCHERYKCKQKLKSHPALRDRLNSSAHTPATNNNAAKKPLQPAQTSQKYGSLPSQANLPIHGHTGRSSKNKESSSDHSSLPKHVTRRESHPRKRSSRTPPVPRRDINSPKNSLMTNSREDPKYKEEGPAALVLTGLEREISTISKQLCNSLGHNDSDSGKTQETENSTSHRILRGKNYWSVIPTSRCTDTMGTLAKRCHSPEDLRSHYYVQSTDIASTLPDSTARFQDFAPTPPRSSQTPKHHAIALDCEMVGVKEGRSELALISAVDFISGEVLLNTLVHPMETVVDWRSRISGVTPHAMALASTRGQTLHGWKEARAEIWRHIDTDTVLVGHALQHDLDVLRMMHPRIVDTAILAKQAVGAGVRRQWGLRVLCDELLGIDIQNHGSQGHDCLEDAFAAREVAIWCIENEGALAVWGAVANEMERAKQEAQRERRAGKQKQKQKLKLKQTRSVRAVYSPPGPDDIEIVRWEDVADDLLWPEGYDPWSD